MQIFPSVQLKFANFLTAVEVTKNFSITRLIWKVQRLIKTKNGVIKKSLLANAIFLCNFLSMQSANTMDGFLLVPGVVLNP